MGYYTRYNITCKPVQTDTFVESSGVSKNTSLSPVHTSFDISSIRAELKSLAGYSFSIVGHDAIETDDCKWYDHKNHMIELSKRHPDILFVVQGIGEENGDIWAMYVLAGRCKRHEAKISFPEFNVHDLC